MLPSKGYFESLNCPYYQNGLCNRPHCHFRHTRKDKSADENQQEDVDQLTATGDVLTDAVEETSSDCSWPAHQPLPSTSVSYKPTPITELKKRHIPVTTAPSVNLSNSQKRRIEYDVKGIRKPKVRYIPEAVTSDSNSKSVYSTNTNNTTYRATKICNQPDGLLNGSNTEENTPLHENEESEEEIDFDQVSNELNFLDEILKQYEKPVSIKDLISKSNFTEDRIQNEENQEKKNKAELSSENTSNGFVKHQIQEEKNHVGNPSESDCRHSSEIKEHEDEKNKSNNCDSKNRSVNNGASSTEKSKPKTSTSGVEREVKSNSEHRRKSVDNHKGEVKSNSEHRRKSVDNHKGEVKSNSEHRRKSVDHHKDGVKNSTEHKRKSLDHHKSERDKNKNKGSIETSSSSKSTKKESASASSFDKLVKSDTSKSSNSIKQTKKEHGYHKSSNKESEHRSSSSKSTKKDSERDSNSNKPSTKDSDRKNSSSKSHKKESDQLSKHSKSSRYDHESSRKRTHSPESHSNNKRHKENSKTEHKHSDTKRFKHEENRHRKESNEKRSVKKHSNAKELKRRERHACDTHSVSESNGSDVESDDVEIISEAESIIVIDSEEETNFEKNVQERSSSSEHSPGMASPTYLTDVSDMSADENNAQGVRAVISPPDEVIGAKKNNDDASLVDHRVQSRIKNRVSLGNVWRPQTKKPVEIMTPAQRILLFAKLREKEREEKEKGEKEDSHPTSIKIGCVRNVKSLLEEKRRILNYGKTSTNENFPQANSNIVKDKTPQNQIVDKDETPTAPLGTKHPRNRGADLFTRRAMLEKLYKVEKQLLHPNNKFRDAKDKTLQSEAKIWEANNHDTYEKEVNNLILRRKSELPEFTLRYYRLIKPKQSTMFPKELRKKPENGENVESSPTSEESLYWSLQKYCLTDEQLESEGYPRKKSQSTSDKMIVYINQESLMKWKKPQAVPPRGEFQCSNCSKFYAVDENGFSIKRWDCQYHAKKAFRTTKDKSGLLEKKARCCGNGQDSPCMTSEFHSTESRDLQNLEGFVETKEPVGEMPREGWGIFALDCEMYWSTRGSELGRVTVVNADERTVYDTFVRPEFPVTDYCTRMSGMTKENLENANKTLAQVQSDLLKIFNSETILIGHSLENDLKALQIVHNKVVDTAMVFKSGEYKMALKTLAREILKEVIQNDEDGHDSAEDATTCIKLMMHKAIKDAIALARRAPPAPRGRYRANIPAF